MVTGKKDDRNIATLFDLCEKKILLIPGEQTPSEEKVVNPGFTGNPDQPFQPVKSVFIGIDQYGKPLFVFLYTVYQG